MSFQKGLREIWDDLMSYRTLKVVKISDARLSYVHKSLMASILVYSTISMIGSHTYMLKEKPRMYVSTSIDDSARESNRAALDLSTLAYCDQSATDFTGHVSLSEGGIPGGAYLSAECAKHFTTTQLARVDDGSSFIGTHIRQQAWERTCADEVNLDGCEVANAGPQRNYFPADVESLRLTMRPTYVTSWGVSEPPHAMFVVGAQGEAYAEFDIWNEDPEKRYPSFNLTELLSLAPFGSAKLGEGPFGLDERNELYSLSQPDLTPAFNGSMPLYRVTGARVQMAFTFSNFRPMSEGRPFHFQPQAKIEVKLISRGQFVASKDETFYTGDPGNFDRSGTLVNIRGVKIEYQAKGLMGKADGYTAMMALMSCLVMVGVATAIVDVIGAFIYDSFKDDKIEDDGERQHLEHMILNIETTGVPFKHEDLQMMPEVSVKDFLQMLQKDILKLSTLAHHMSRDLAQAGLNRHTLDISKMDKQPKDAPRFTCFLTGPDRSQIFLTGGPQTIGRGHGGVTNRRVSHKQVSVRADTHTGACVVSGLLTKNTSAVGIGGGAWRPLIGRDDGSEEFTAEVELQPGDYIALLYDPGEDEAETYVEGVFMYGATPVVDLTESATSPSPLAWLGL